MKAKVLTSNILISAVSGEIGSALDNSRQAIEFELELYGRSVPFQLNVPDAVFRLSDIVPIARTISDRITGIVIEKLQCDGDQVSCQKGCSVCCSYLVPLSIPEMFRFEEIIRSKSKSKSRQLMRSCVLAARSIIKQKPPGIFACETDGQTEQGTVDITVVSDWYSNLKVNCPFVLNGICVAYEERPLVCREHFVTISPQLCKEKDGIALSLDMPVHVSTALSQLTGELEGMESEALLLPFIPVWCEENRYRNDRKWPAFDMVNRFVQILKQMSSKSLALPVGSSV